jgi:ribosomal protein S15P/S13E
MVGRRAGLLRYLARTEPERYTDVIQRLGIRR